jgi:hypothetical protein
VMAVALPERYASSGAEKRDEPRQGSFGWVVVTKFGHG